MGCSNLKPTACGGSRKPFLSTIGCSKTMHFTGITNITVNQGTEIDLISGVHAYDALGEEIPFTVSPSYIDPDDVGVHTVTYTATGQSINMRPYLCGKNAHENPSCEVETITATRTVTIIQTIIALQNENGIDLTDENDNVIEVD